MTKREFVQTIAKDLGLTQHQAQQIATFTAPAELLSGDTQPSMRTTPGRGASHFRTASPPPGVMWK